MLCSCTHIATVGVKGLNTRTRSDLGTATSLSHPVHIHVVTEILSTSSQHRQVLDRRLGYHKVAVLRFDNFILHQHIFISK